jgi:UDP-glucose 6-dehydrogenase
MVNAAKTKPFGFMPFYPGLGVGGYCIPVNPYYLANGDFSNLSCLYTSLKNTEMRPIEKAREILKENTNAKRILVVGAAFKPGEVLLVNSPSIDLVNTIINEGVDVVVYDPLVVRDPKNYNNVFPTSPQKSYLHGLFNKLTMSETPKGTIKWMPKDEFSVTNLIDNFDVVIVALKQHEIDWSVLDKYERFDKKVYWFIDRNEVIKQ